MSVDKFEEVFDYDWYDGPIQGVANRNDKPYFFEYQGYQEEERDCYYLTPINQGLLVLVMESWQIWKRWDVAFHQGETSQDTHPYLPKDRQRGELVQQTLDDALKIDKSNFIELNAEFRVKKN